MENRCQSGLKVKRRRLPAATVALSNLENVETYPNAFRARGEHRLSKRNAGCNGSKIEKQIMLMLRT